MSWLLQRLRDWRQRRKWAAMHLEWLRTMVYGDARWLASNPIASALTQRYEAALRDDWYALDHEDTPRLRTRLGLDPSRATDRVAAPDAARLAIEAVLQTEYVALKPGECVPLQTSAPVTYPGLEAIYMAGMQHAAAAPRAAACAQPQADAAGEPVQWGDPRTVGMFIRQLQTIDHEAPIYAAFHADYEGKRRAMVRGVTLSRERVKGRFIATGDTSVPYAHVVWSQPQADAAEPVSSGGAS